jgi:hypothetical protein
MLQKPVSVTGSLAYPPSDASGPSVPPFPFNFVGTYSSEANFDLELSGAGSKVLDLGTATPAKVALVRMAPDATGLQQPIFARLNGVAPGQEITPGGFIIICNPAPTANGLTSLTIVSTTAARVNIRVLG